jgi:arginyl-tRNA synthetase
MKPDHFVGKYYVEFEKKFQAEFKDWTVTEQCQEEYGKWQNSSSGKNFITKAKKYYS